MPAWRVALATLYLHTGRPAEARREYDRLAERDFATIPRDNVWSMAIALLAELCETFRDAERSRLLEELLEPLDGRNVVTPDGHLRRPGAALPGADRRRPRRPGHARSRRLAEAREACERMGYKPMLAVLDVDEARMLARRDGPGDVEHARELLQRGLERAEEVGVPRLDERLARAAALLPAPRRRRRRPPSRPRRRRRPCWRARATSGAWTTRAASLRVRDAKGMRHLALLLANPGVEFHAVDVATRGRGRRRGRRAQRPPRRPRACRAGTGDAGPALDSQAKAEYRSRLEDLRAEIEEAEAFNDPERAARAREEMDFIAHELSAAVGLGGRDRHGGLGGRARPRERHARAAARDPAHRRRGRGPRARAGDDRPHRHLLRLRARPAASGGAGTWHAA